ncbi:hypothetical protein PVAP13_6KG308306 [Panicum virgatum]|uniref:Uncharacterized protein n=2 Tax=Panicum virgatum TaxID=38727 RepID=A0A8T0RHA0_PANVG|nr:hypothetical protein PVAP13_6KG308306 [Panicum virgatum]
MRPRRQEPPALVAVDPRASTAPAPPIRALAPCQPADPRASPPIRTPAPRAGTTEGRQHAMEAPGHSWLPTGGPLKKRKTNVAPPCESSIVPVGPKIMHFPPRSGSGSNQPEPLSMEYPALPACETTPPPAISKPTTKKAAKGKAKEPKGKAQTAKGKAKAAGKKKKKKVSVPHDSPAMGTRSKTTP